MFSPRTYGKIVAIFYGLLVVLGLIPATNTLFGLVPIYGNDVWLHLVLGAIGAYFGFRGETDLIGDAESHLRDWPAAVRAQGKKLPPTFPIGGAMRYRPV